MRRAGGGLTLDDLSLSRQHSGSSAEASPSPGDTLSDSGKFRIGNFEISRDGVAEKERGGAARASPSLPPVAEQPSPKKGAASADVQFSDLQPLQIIGRGASGFVRRAEHLPTGRMLAVKEICIADKARRKQIFNEITTLRGAAAAEAGETHLLDYMGVRYTEGSIQICMEYMDGGSLGDLLARSGPLPTEAMADITRQTLLALAHLRDRHLVHRDLKPQNILLNLRGECKVSDFGCVAELQDSFGKCGTFVGTVPYMSPERIQGEEYSYASDVWALGLTLVECAQGHFPYARKNGYWGILEAVLKQPSPSLPSGRFAEELVDFVNWCLKKAPEERSSAKVLLQHPFIENGERSAFSLRAFLHSALGLVDTQAASGEDEAANGSGRPLPSMGLTGGGFGMAANVRGGGHAGDGEAEEGEYGAEEVVEEVMGGEAEGEAEAIFDGGSARSHATGPSGAHPAASPRSSMLHPSQTGGRESPALAGQMELLVELNAVMERNAALESKHAAAEAEVSSLRQELQATQHASRQLQLQFESSQELIGQLQARIDAGRRGSHAQPAVPPLSQLARARDDESALLALEPRSLDRMHPADVERLLTISERNVLEVKAAIRRRSKLLVRRSKDANAAKPGVPGMGGVVGGRAKISSRPSSGRRDLSSR